MFHDHFFQCGKTGLRGFRDHRHLGRLLHHPVPLVNGFNFAQDIYTGGDFFTYQRGGNYLCFFPAGRRHINEERLGFVIHDDAPF